jgi:spore coat polysaccharide biosynthesis protein SpsF
MGSSRLPGKMMRTLMHRPVIDHVISRLTTGLHPKGPLNGIVLATSDSELDDPLVDHIQKKWPQLTIVRESENNVVGRFVTALKDEAADIVVRVTGDCPLVNVDVLSGMIEAHQGAGADVTNYMPGFEYVDKGLEVVAASALHRVAEDPEATTNDLEHVTALMYRRPDRYKVHYINSKDYLRRGDVRLTIDTEADLKFMEALFQNINKRVKDLSLKEVIDHFDQNPDLKSINATAGCKSTMHEKARLGFRCDGNPKIGLGHVVGSLRLAKAVAKELKMGVEFLVREDKSTVALIQKAGFAVEVLSPNFSKEKDIQRIIAKTNKSDWAGVVINFCKNALDDYGSIFQQIPDTGKKLIFMDNPVPSSYRKADLVINALPHPDYNGYDSDDHPACYDGLDYFLLDEAFTSYNRKSRLIGRNIERILVSMGGADVDNSTGLVIEGLAMAGYQGWVDIVLGTANPHTQLVQKQFRQRRLRGEINVGVSVLPERMWKADVGFSALGLTTYEMAFMGLPIVLIASTPLNADVAKRYADRHGGSIYLGLDTQTKPIDIAHCVTQILFDQRLRQKMSELNRSLVDGEGIHRVVSLIEREICLNA